MIETASSMSSSNGGSGTSMIARMPSTPTASAISPRMTARRDVAEREARPLWLCGVYHG